MEKKAKNELRQSNSFAVDFIDPDTNESMGLKALADAVVLTSGLDECWDDDSADDAAGIDVMIYEDAANATSKELRSLKGRKFHFVIRCLSKDGSPNEINTFSECAIHHISNDGFDVTAKKNAPRTTVLNIHHKGLTVTYP